MTGTPRWFDTLVKDIVALRVQGAENVAREAVRGIARLADERPGTDLKKAAGRLIATRPTEPMMRNALAYFLANADERGAARVRDHLLAQFDAGDRLIAAYAAGLVKDGCYATHCHSSTVVDAFLEAKRRGRGFTVRNTETRPRFQGRITASGLAAAGIPVIHAVDAAMRTELDGCVAVFLGADALLRDGSVANKIGSGLLAELAFSRRIPVYILASSWKYDERPPSGYEATLEHRSPSEVWPDAPKGVSVRNIAFEIVDARHITAFVTELGIREPQSTIAEIERRRRWRAVDGRNA